MSAPTHAGRTLDWVPRFDERSRGYGVAPGADLPATGAIWRPGRILDQGSEGACVGYGCAAEAASEPVPVPRVTNSYARAWYRQAQRRDQWPGENYSGTSVLAGCLEGRARGLYGGFRWSFSAEELAAGVVAEGPAIVGVEWTANSYETSPAGVLEPGGAVVGGHCICVVGFLPGLDGLDDALRNVLEDLDLFAGLEQIDGPAFVIQNSWGEGWGRHGLALASLDTVRGWVRAGAEFAHPVDRRLPQRKGTAVSEADQVAGEQDERPDNADPGEQEPGSGDVEPAQPGSQVLHPVVTELRQGDRLYLPGWAEDLLGQESATVHDVQVVPRGVTHVARIETSAGILLLPTDGQVKVRRSNE